MAKTVTAIDGGIYNSVKGLRMRTDPTKVFYDTDIPTANAAGASDITKGKKAVVNGEEITGTREQQSMNLTTLKATWNNHTYVAPDNTAYTQVEVDVPTENYQPKTQVKTVTIGQNAGSVYPDSGYDLLQRVDYSVSSQVDSMIKPENIKAGVSILGVVGTLKESIEKQNFVYVYRNGLTSSYDIYIRMDWLKAEDDTATYNFRYVTSGSYTGAWGSNMLCTYDETSGCHKISIGYGSNTTRRYQIRLSHPYADGYLYIELQQAVTSYAVGRWFDTTKDTSRTTDTYQYYVVNTVALAKEPDLNAAKGEGSFTPASTDYVSGGRIKIPWEGWPRFFAVWREGGLDGTEELYEPVVYTTFSTGGDDIYLSNRCYGNQSATNGYNMSGNPYTKAVSGEFPLTDDATSNARAIYISADGIYCKTYGDYRFRVGTTYRYKII